MVKQEFALTMHMVLRSMLILKKMEFCPSFDEKIQSSLDSGNLVCVQLYGNSKFGGKVIQNDPHDMSNNGKLLLDLLTRKNKK